MKTHELKISTLFFNHTKRGLKKFEFRFNDRGFALGDRLLLREFVKSESRYTGKELLVEVTYILDCCPIMDNYSVNYVVLQIEPVKPQPIAETKKNSCLDCGCPVELVGAVCRDCSKERGL